MPLFLIIINSIIVFIFFYHCYLKLIVIFLIAVNQGVNQGLSRC